MAEYVRAALRHGARGYLLKDAAPQELLAALAAVQRGETWLSPAVSKGVLSDYVQRLRGDANAEPALTPRQLEVLQKVAQGHSTKDVARLLGLSVKTVDTHRSQIMKQLDIHEVTGLVRYALRTGLISADLLSGVLPRSEQFLLSADHLLSRMCLQAPDLDRLHVAVVVHAGSFAELFRRAHLPARMSHPVAVVGQRRALGKAGGA